MCFVFNKKFIVILLAILLSTFMFLFNTVEIIKTSNRVNSKEIENYQLMLETHSTTISNKDTETKSITMAFEEVHSIEEIIEPYLLSPFHGWNKVLSYYLHIIIFKHFLLFVKEWFTKLMKISYPNLLQLLHEIYFTDESDQFSFGAI